MKFLKSKFFIICLSVALVLTIIPTVLSAMGQTGFVRNAFVTVTYPLRWLFNGIADGIGGFTDYFTRFDELKEENERLRSELEAANEKADKAQLALEENQWLRDYFGISEADVELTLLNASIIGYETSNTKTIYMLDAGTLNGVRKDMAVITQSGVVGCITEAGLNWSKVTTIIEDSMAVSAYAERTGDYGIVRGDYGLREEGICLMSEIDSNSQLEVGDRILTGGIGSVYPRGILIGRVRSITAVPETHTLRAVIEPAVDFSRLDRLMIVTGSKPAAESTSETASETVAVTASETVAVTASETAAVTAAANKYNTAAGININATGMSTAYYSEIYSEINFYSLSDSRRACCVGIRREYKL